MLLVSILCLLLSNSLSYRRDLSIYFNRISILIIFYCITQNIITLLNLNKGIGLHGGLIHITNITQFFQIFILLICILILQLTSFYGRKINVSLGILNILKINTLKVFLYKQFYINNISYKIQKIINLAGIEHMKIIEYPLILLFVINGAIFLICSNDLVTVFLSIELQSYGLYILSTIYRNSELSTIGGLIYFLLGGLSSCFILLGTSLLYANSGATCLESIYIITAMDDINNINY